MTFAIQSEPELPAVARELLVAFPDRRIFALYGAMGAGKTTFIKTLCRELGVEDAALSPTFAIINEYHTTEDIPVYHFDFYRINKLDEVFDLGYEEYLYSGHYCFLEWPELVEELLPEETVKVRIEGEDKRLITF
ncbi:MAG: tRNA (adenosine(37)-N6)-threonylcarbamoyltransferase complex ATPase subunit type 1 TsaE [Bacteroidetes bacterium]|nr:MAG: tRNA (adenosine(37)-N6)-threonylcarbamoyltransferase complex ATPase subunit type 1 TsaE [Bacteroidota bacterium]